MYVVVLPVISILAHATLAIKFMLPKPRVIHGIDSVFQQHLFSLRKISHITLKGSLRQPLLLLWEVQRPGCHPGPSEPDPLRWKPRNLHFPLCIHIILSTLKLRNLAEHDCTHM